MLSISPSPLSKIPISSPAPAPHRTRSRPLVISNTATAYKERPNLYLSPQRMASCTSPYEILGIPVGATSQDIKTAYRRLARTCHPDVAALDRKDTSADDFMKIHAAYSTLSDPEKRAVYDRKFIRRNRPLTTSFSGYHGRNWETDQCW
ncbi:chaperone protein dnaJ 11, chloroplastic [Manihot esculenta]|uniref:J domain-containing protein n=1 Tax=Manihot esculenta TaxID=3983 RepID=A0A2C9WKW9_MANES|nr:chaperone protein dnaJ 11, chloroplastic [Manihot esculenta]OAY60872.1 hypothetical protein MANES_01G146100v8 [Manihot esculenta]